MKHDPVDGAALVDMMDQPMCRTLIDEAAFERLKAQKLVAAVADKAAPRAKGKIYCQLTPGGLEAANALRGAQTDPATGADPDEGDSAAVAAISAADALLDVDTLAGDLRDTILGWFRESKAAWGATPEMEQRAIIDAIGSGCRQLVRRTVLMLAERDFDSCRVVIGDARAKATKDGVAIEMKAATVYSDEAMAFLAGRVGSVAMIVGADAGDYMGEREPAEADPDQPSLPMEEREALEAAAAREADVNVRDDDADLDDDLEHGEPPAEPGAV